MNEDQADGRHRVPAGPGDGATMADRIRKTTAQQYAESRVPRYLQVASALKGRIKDGRWSVGEKIATLEELEREFGVARVTIRQAIDLLQSEGLLRSFQGKGTYVTKGIESERWLNLAADWQSLIDPIAGNVPHMLMGGAEPAPRIEDGQGTPADAYVFIRSLQMRGKEPFALARVHVAKAIHERAPKLFSSKVALAVIAQMPDLDISRAHQTLTIGTADIETARHLGIPLNAPTAEAHCVVTDSEGIVIYVGEITYRGDVVRIDIELRQ